MASYKQLYDYYVANVADPSEPQGDAWNNNFNAWTNDLQNALGVTNWDEIPASEIGNFEYQGGTSNAVPLEQYLLGNVVDRYVTPDVAADAGRQAQGQDILSRVNSGIDQALSVNGQALDGSRLAAEYDMANQTDAARRAALQPLLDSRTAAAETASAGVNQGLESERDRILAEDALKGFYGGSSLNDANLLRATIGARQNAAQIMAGANVANAGDTRTIGDDTARQRNLYFDSDYGRRLDAALRIPALEGGRLTAATAADNYGQSGINRSLGLLNWFSNQTPAPTVSPYFQQADQRGADIAGLGAGLVGSGLQLAAARNWGSTAPRMTSAGAVGNLTASG